MGQAPVRYHLGKFPPQDIDWVQLIPLIGSANACLARYDGLLTAIPNSQILLSPLVTQEAVLSSKIEGTHVTISEVLEIEAGGKSDSFTQPKRDDAEEVLNYRKAMTACVSEMQHRPLSQQIIRAAHGILMQGVRGRDKSPGNYRHEQNWIGAKGCKTIDQASFVPIAPELLRSGMDEWEKYMGGAERDPLTQLAILHVEFEALHPFNDGNGRLGRMLIPLYLFQRGLLHSPDFYMSSYLEKTREEYQERLRAVSRDNDWTGWCSFFLQGICHQAAENEAKARAILSLYDRIKNQIADLVHSQHSIRAVDFLFQTPVFSAPTFTNHSEIPKQTANRILTLLRENDILSTIREGKGRRSGIYAFLELISIAEGRELG